MDELSLGQKILAGIGALAALAFMFYSCVSQATDVQLDRCERAQRERTPGERVPAVLDEEWCRDHLGLP